MGVFRLFFVFTPFLEERKSEILSNWAKVRVLKQRLYHMLLLLRTFQWLLIHPK